MSCPKTQHLLQEYFSDDLTPLSKKEIENHIYSCEQCSNELEFFLLAQNKMQGWKDQRVPHWDRGTELFKREHHQGRTETEFWNRWLWVPTAVSLVMFCALLFNLSVVFSEQEFSISFGAKSFDRQLQSQLIEFQQQQRAEMDVLVLQVGDRVNSGNVQLMRTVMEQAQEAAVENLDRIYAYFEQQRLRDLEDMRVGYQELVNSDYETIRSLQQLAQFHSYQGSTVR